MKLVVKCYNSQWCQIANLEGATAERRPHLEADAKFVSSMFGQN
jgi:hypothetical protein